MGRRESSIHMRINTVIKTLMLGCVLLFLGELAFAAQCAAITKKGTQCKRQASVGSIYCWQHGGKTQQAPEAIKGDHSVSVSTSSVSDKSEGRCLAITKKGTQCKRMAEKGSVYCWQHVGVSNNAVATKGAPATGKEKKARSLDMESGRCQAITKKGTRCKRSAKPGSNFCWQHGG